MPAFLVDNEDVDRAVDMAPIDSDGHSARTMKVSLVPVQAFDCLCSACSQTISFSLMISSSVLRILGVEDTEHFLLKCHAYDNQRRDLLGAINEVLQ